MNGWLLLAAALAAGMVVIVALPFLRDPAPASDALHELDAHERALLEAEEERDRALSALKELEADHRAGRLTDDSTQSRHAPCSPPPRPRHTIKPGDTAPTPNDLRRSAARGSWRRRRNLHVPGAFTTLCD